MAGAGCAAMVGTARRGRRRGDRGGRRGRSRRRFRDRRPGQHAAQLEADRAIKLGFVRAGAFDEVQLEMTVAADDGQHGEVRVRAELAPESEPRPLRAQRPGGVARRRRVGRHGRRIGRRAHGQPQIARVHRDRVHQRAPVDRRRVGRPEPDDDRRVASRRRRWFRRGRRLLREQRVQRESDV